VGIAVGAQELPSRWVTGLYQREVLERDIGRGVEMIIASGGKMSIKKQADMKHPDISSFNFLATPRSNSSVLGNVECQA